MIRWREINIKHTYLYRKPTIAFLIWSCPYEKKLSILGVKHSKERSNLGVKYFKKRSNLSVISSIEGYTQLKINAQRKPSK